ncbi:MAG: nucleotidyltransferase family protein [Firmicutes bacterium]|nr:nucleotidyltransferase family protein [Bacillota bacterium]
MGANASTPKGVLIILAAGLGTRLGGRDKGALPWPQGATLLGHQLVVAEAAGFESLAVVRGGDVALPQRVVNRSPQDGLASSLKIGLKAARDRFGEVTLGILLVDQPFVTPEDILTVYEAFQRRPSDVHAVRARYDGTPGHPVFFDSHWDGRVSQLHGDRGLGPLWTTSEDARWVDIAVGGRPHPAFDIDTDEAYLKALTWVK